MIYKCIFILTAILLGASAAFVGQHEGKLTNRPKLILGANKCTWGPSYSCKNISTSHECGATPMCVDRVWPKIEPKPDQSEVCGFCISTLKNMEAAMSKNITFDVVESFIDEICLAVPVVSKVCVKYLHPYIEDIYFAIYNNIKPDVTCHVIHFCSNEKTTEETFHAVSENDETTKMDQAQIEADFLAPFQPLGPAMMMTGNSKAVFGGDKVVAPLTCKDGQVYWCQSEKTALECRALEHCKQVVWSHTKKPTPNPTISEIQDSTGSHLAPINSILNYNRISFNSVECNQGQSFWCTNLTSAASCRAVSHCIQSVWMHMRVEEDNDSVCKICKDMVKQARDQLLSNETQNDLKLVLEGSCNLMPVKVVREGCDRLVDVFIPELVETLSSQMNPDIVCSVAGLCNNVQIDRLLKLTGSPVSTRVSDDSDCPNCASFALSLKSKFIATSKSQVVNVMKTFCSELSSLSDVCYKVVDSHSDVWYSHLNYYFLNLVNDGHNPFSVLTMCRVHNMCNNETVSFPENAGIAVEVNHRSEQGKMISTQTKSDIPCDLCSQLVLHLRDIFVANTTKTEFKQVLEGICKQTGGYSAECSNLVNLYYERIYDFLTSELNPNGICTEVGLCPKKPTVVFNNLDVLAKIPIVPIELLPISVPSTKTEKPARSSSALVESQTKPVCVMCEYVLHFVQEQVADKKNEGKILAAMQNACSQMPGEFSSECQEFIKEYGQAFVALIIQQIDPSVVCPKLKVCSVTVKAPMVFTGEAANKGSCPLCLLVVQSVEAEILNNRTEEQIKSALENVCKSFPQNLKADCSKMVDTYYDLLIDSIVAEAKPDEFCAYIKLCLPPKRKEEASVVTALGVNSNLKDDQACILCEFIMTHVDKLIQDKKTEEEIKHAVHGVCRIMPKTIKQQCDDFVNKYADLILELLSQSIAPKEICQALSICPNHLEIQAKEDVKQCAICKEAMNHLDDVEADEDQKFTPVDKVCYHVEQSQFDECNKFIQKYGTDILKIVDFTPSYQICEKIKVCASTNLFVDTESLEETHPDSVESDHSASVEKTVDDSSNDYSPDTFIQKKSTQIFVEIEPAEKSTESGFFSMDACKRIYGVTLCTSQLVGFGIGLLLIALLVLKIVTRRMRRQSTGHTPYAKLYQPTTYSANSREGDDMTAAIVS